ncbi:MAG TPA: 4Fe-4S dicluster domain-containing protein [Clostridiaceae bacterium]|nr:4Fe-4S dicluster domain-containing protein [Clostridiaceae bacterium]
MAGYVRFREDLCKGCELCVYVCPPRIIYLDRDYTNRKGYHPVRIDEMEKCTGCAHCARMCPDSVITVERE